MSPQLRGLSVSFFKYLISLVKIQKVILPAFLPVLNKHCSRNELYAAVGLIPLSRARRQSERQLQEEAFVDVVEIDAREFLDATDAMGE